MKFISLAVIALIASTEAIKLKDMELDEDPAAEANAQVAQTQGDVEAAGIDPAQLQALAEAQAAQQAQAGAGAAATVDASANSDPQYLASSSLEGGITVNVLENGKGGQCGVGQTASVQYTGALASNGQVFDTSVGGEPISFNIGSGQVIKCWENALPQMSVGTKADVGCPSATAYGSTAQTNIPANSDLIFNVEVVGCQ